MRIRETVRIRPLSPLDSCAMPDNLFQEMRAATHLDIYKAGSFVVYSGALGDVDIALINNFLLENGLKCNVSLSRSPEFSESDFNSAPL